MKYLDWWVAYWFRPAPIINLAICRIVLVGYQLFHLSHSAMGPLIRLSELPDSLYRPLPILRFLTLPFGWNYRPSLDVLEAVYWITFVAGILAFVGLKTNFSLVVFAVGNVFLIAFIYSFLEWHHPEAVMMIALSILALCPSGGVLSIDDIWRRRSNTSKNQRFDSFNILGEDSVFARWPLLLIQWMFVLIYLSAATSKLGTSGIDWMNGYTLQYYLFRDGIGRDKPLGVWLAQYHILVMTLQWISIIFQSTFALVMIFPRLVWVYIPIGLGFHTVIYLAIGAPFFQWIFIYVVFISWAALAKGISCKVSMPRAFGKPEVLYDGQCPLCIRSMTLICYFDWFERFTYSDLTKRLAKSIRGREDISLEGGLREMYLLMPDGSVKQGFFAFREMIWYLPLLWPLLIIFYFPMASVLGPNIYKYAASRRGRFEKCTFDGCLQHSKEVIQKGSDSQTIMKH
jgi:predicted DCC family thiol-disulfide oxidoreductase YuxK/uncharacterized membrane protein YphA (DoxX/SURF4 family)